MADVDTADVERIVRQLAVRRVLLGYSQCQVAEHLGIVQSQISNWETGRALPRGGHLARYARLVGLRLAVVDDAQTAKALLTPDDPALPEAVES